MLLFVDDESWGQRSTPEELKRGYEAVGKWWEEHSAAGRIVGGEELKGTRTATTLRRKSGKITVTDGPFIESKEALGGFAIVDVPDLDAAIALAKTWPALQADGDAVEIRPIVEHRDAENVPVDRVAEGASR
jgi:hypothetical protein